MAAVRLRSRGVMVSARGAAGVWGIRASLSTFQTGRRTWRRWGRR
ncbi:MAG: hypothetical protein RXP86_09475 [Acidilobus sp.]